MEFKRCEKGHIYDGNTKKNCPYCEKLQKQNQCWKNKLQTKTKIIARIKVNPVGNGQCVLKVAKGRDYRLTDKRNLVGKSTDMDVCILGDDNINDDNHFSITYNSDKRILFCSQK